MRTSLLLFAGLFLVFPNANAQKQKIVLESVWRVKNLPNPESIAYDGEREVFYVSNQNSGGKPGAASIGVISLDGKQSDPTWITGLTDPKGIVLNDNGKLFVANAVISEDGKEKSFELVEIDVLKGKIVERYPAEGAGFLNDVAIDSKGSVYVSDMFNSSIYKLNLKEKKLELWFESPKLENPNGLLFQGEKLLISAWGRFTDRKPLEAPPGNLLELSEEDGEKVVKKLSKKPIGNLDGIQEFGENGLILSDWVSGNIYVVNSDGEISKTLSPGRSVGDVLYVKELGLLLVPMATQGEVLAYKLTKK